MKKIYLILDTDAGSDCDDMLALAYLVYAKKNLGVEVNAVTYAQTCPHGIPMLRVLFRQLGQEEPEMGALTHADTFYDNYAKGICDRWAKKEDFSPVDEGYRVLRKVLAESDGGVTICAIGPLSNISALLQSRADEISPLDGTELVREKCEKLVLMAGGFVAGENGKNTAEWNVKLDISAAKAVAELSPIPTVWLPYETGLDIKTGGFLLNESAERDALTYSFVTFPFIDPDGRHSWDPATLMYAVEGCKDFLIESECGTVTVDDDGVTEFYPCENGLHTILRIKPMDGKTELELKAECAKYIDKCVKEVL